jgi:hypothetical protein
MSRYQCSATADHGMREVLIIHPMQERLQSHTWLEAWQKKDAGAGDQRIRLRSEDLSPSASSGRSVQGVRHRARRGIRRSTQRVPLKHEWDRGRQGESAFGTRR